MAIYDRMSATHLAPLSCPRVLTLSISPVLTSPPSTPLCSLLLWFTRGWLAWSLTTVDKQFFWNGKFFFSAISRFSSVHRKWLSILRCSPWLWLVVFTGGLLQMAILECEGVWHFQRLSVSNCSHNIVTTLTHMENTYFCCSYCSFKFGGLHKIIQRAVNDPNPHFRHHWIRASINTFPTISCTNSQIRRQVCVEYSNCSKKLRLCPKRLDFNDSHCRINNNNKYLGLINHLS